MVWFFICTGAGSWKPASVFKKAAVVSIFHNYCEFFGSPLFLQRVFYFSLMHQYCNDLYENPGTNGNINKADNENKLQNNSTRPNRRSR